MVENGSQALYDARFYQLVCIVLFQLLQDCLEDGLEQGAFQQLLGVRPDYCSQSSEAGRHNLEVLILRKV